MACPSAMPPPLGVGMIPTRKHSVCVPPPKFGSRRWAARAFSATLILPCALWTASGVVRSAFAVAPLGPSGTVGLRRYASPRNLLGSKHRPLCVVRNSVETDAAASSEGDAPADEEDWGCRIRVDELEVGQELVGIVNSVRHFGAFVDVGADRDGLVHISRITEGFVDNIVNYVEPGQEVKVWVTEVTEDGKLGLSMVEGRGKDDGRDIAAELAQFEAVPIDQWIEGTVQQITDFGLYVSVAPPSGGPVAQGLVHISQIKEGYVEHPAEEAEVGQKVKVRVYEVDPENARLRLSMKEYREGVTPMGRPTDELLSAFEGVTSSEWFVGKVHHTAPFGIFVEVESPSGGGIVQGMVHVGEIRDGFVDDPADEVQDGQEVKVRVINVDVGAGRLSLSMKPLQAA